MMALLVLLSFAEASRLSCFPALPAGRLVQPGEMLLVQRSLLAPLDGFDVIWNILPGAYH